jgi:hypothetical protein
MPIQVPPIDDIAQKAASLTLQSGGHVNMIHAFQEEKVHVMAVPYMPPMKVVRYALMRDLARKLRQQSSRRHGKLTDVFFISEAWMIRTTKERIANEPTPSQHPDRIEVLIVAHYNIPAAKYDLRMYEMLRAGDSLDLQVLDGMDSPEEVKSDLIEHFVKGWG